MVFTPRRASWWRRPISHAGGHDASDQSVECVLPEETTRQPGRPHLRRADRELASIRWQRIRETATMPYVMRRIRAFLLLVTLLTTPSLMFASAIFAAPQTCCCCGAMCPMRHAARKDVRKKICGDLSDRTPKCSCHIGQAPTTLMIFAVDRGTIDPVPALRSPILSRSPRFTSFEYVLDRFTAPPEQPPRSLLES